MGGSVQRQGGVFLKQEEILYLFMDEQEPKINDNQENCNLSEEEIESFTKTRQDYLDGKTTARSWEEVKKDLKELYGKQ